MVFWVFVYSCNVNSNSKHSYLDGFLIGIYILLTQFPLYQYHTLLKVDTMLLNIYQNLEFFNKTLDKGKGYVNEVTYDEARVELYFSVVNLHNVILNLLLATINSKCENLISLLN